jgi:putative PEP-CTERM system histidine kinase
LIIFFINAFNYTILLSLLLDARIKEAGRCFSFGIIRIFFLIPFLAVEYLYFGVYMQGHLAVPLFFSETVFGLTWINLALHLPNVIDPDVKLSSSYHLTSIFFVICGVSLGSYWLFISPAFKISDYHLLFPYHGLLYFSSLFVLIACLVMAWRVETFWRKLPPKDRWLYKYLVIGILLISGSIGWSTSFRIAYLWLNGDHLFLLSIFLLTAWLLISYAVIRNRLLNRKIFVSRKVVYSTIAPIAFAAYLITLGVITLLMRSFGWSLHFVLQWLMIIAGLLLITALAFSGKVRAKVKFFISTHFYVNKYEYRDEWLSFSNLLQGKLTETDVVEALRQVLHDSLYTDIIKIWLGDAINGFYMIDTKGDRADNSDSFLAGNDPLVVYLQNNSYLDCKTNIPNSVCQCILREKNDFIFCLGLTLIVPLTVGGQCVGLIGLGPEHTGGKYGADDFDLLAALGSQAASAMLAVRTAEELARVREKSAWETLSAFVLHDIKNAATMLSLVQENAPQHIHNPEFQQDMLVSIDDALKRMAKVQARLNTLKGEISPVLAELEICRLLKNCSQSLAKKLPDLSIDVHCRNEIRTQADPEFMSVILENLVLNSLEAVGSETRLMMEINIDEKDRDVQVEFIDNGPGIPIDMLPDRLFEPFATAKKKGSGIGLWQVRQLIGSLGGKIQAQNVEGRGARFVIRLPIRREKTVEAI